jgi:hypothetical protein
VAAKKRVIKPKAGSGQKPIAFQPGGLHASTGTPAGQKIPPAKMAAALNGSLGPKAKQRAEFAVNVLGAKKPAGAAKTGANGARKGATRGK